MAFTVLMLAAPFIVIWLARSGSRHFAGAWSGRQSEI
jgi:hypothetical protein